jgi:general transcription factor 3C polypeptide 5 (transcription factor C subunit 1)
MMSHYASSHNVLFKVTVPKRTGRKRKRGSNGPWQGESDEPAEPTGPLSQNLRSESRLDEPKILRRKLQDNVDRYKAEAVGVIKHTHRYRGMADFNYSMRNNRFMNDFKDKILSADGQLPDDPFDDLLLI